MKSYWYAAFVTCAIVGSMAAAAHAAANPPPTIEALREQLRALQAQLVSLQAAAVAPALEPSPDGLAPARRGDRGNAVIAIQRHLITTKDLAIEAPTGYFGALTKKALEQFQGREGIPVTGAMNAETIAAIRERVRGTAPVPPDLPPAPAPPAAPDSPDLAPAGFSNVPPSALAGEPFPFSVLVRNSGAASAPASRMGIFVDGNYAASVDVPEVAPGADSGVTVASAVTMGTGGDHTVTVTLDYDNAIAETSEANNSSDLPVTAASGPVAPAVPPLGYWKFDGSGSSEISGGPSAEEFADASFQPNGGKYAGYAYVPASGDSVKILHTSRFDLPTAFTVEFWFRQRSDRRVVQNLVSKGTESNYNFRVFREVWNASSTGSIVAGYTGGTGAWTELRSSNQLTHGAWHHVAFTKSSAGYAYYLDGSLAQANYAETSAARTPASDIVLGGTAVDTDFDNLKIYNYALNAAEVAHAYRATSASARTPTEQQLASIAAALSVLLENLTTFLR